MPQLPDLPVSVEVTLQLGLIAVAALVAFGVLRTAVGIGMRHLLERAGEDVGGGALSSAELERRVQTIGRLVVRIAGCVIAIIAVLMALRLFGIDIGPAVAGLGVVGIAVGLGAQTVVRDWLAGIFIVLENQYSQGDVVRIAGVDGVVEDFSLRRTTLRDLDGAIHTVPNGQIIVTSNITRIRTPVSLEIELDDGTDLKAVGEIIDRLGAELQADAAWRARILEAPSVLRAEPVSDGAVRLTVLAHARASDQGMVGEELRRRVLGAFAKAGIRVPFPDRVVVGRGDPAGDGTGDAEGAAGP